MHILTETQVATLLDLHELLPVIEDAVIRQGRGEVERPERPHFPVGVGLDSERPDEPLGMGLTMPAYIHGADYYATKLVGFYEKNPERGLPTIHAQIVVTDARTGQPAALMDGTHVTSTRTGCIGGLAAKHLAVGPVDLAVLGAGAQARWQTRAIAAATDLERVRIYSPSDSKYECADELAADLDADVSAVESPEDAVSGATVVVTATTSREPVFSGDDLDPGTVVIAVGAFTPEMQELDPKTFERAAHVFGDVPEEVAHTGDVLVAGLDESAVVSLSDVFEGTAGRTADDEIIVVESVGSAVFDAATAELVYDRARSAGVGETIDL